MIYLLHAICHTHSGQTKLLEVKHAETPGHMSGLFCADFIIRTTYPHPVSSHFFFCRSRSGFVDRLGHCGLHMASGLLPGGRLQHVALGVRIPPRCSRRRVSSRLQSDKLRCYEGEEVLVSESTAEGFSTMRGCFTSVKKMDADRKPLTLDSRRKAKLIATTNRPHYCVTLWPASNSASSFKVITPPDPPPSQPFFVCSSNKPLQVIYIVVLSSACTVNVVNLLATLGALKARTIFTPAPKWSPLAYVEMVHEASTFVSS